MKIVAEPSCAAHGSGCTTSLPAKRVPLGGDFGSPGGNSGKPGRSSGRLGTALAAWRQLRAVGGSDGLGGDLEDQGVVAGRSWGTGRPDLRHRCPGPVVGRTACGSPIGPA